MCLFWQLVYRTFSPVIYKFLISLLAQTIVLPNALRLAKYKTLSAGKHPHLVYMVVLP